MAGTGYGLGIRMEKLGTTTESRTLIGIAIGILMERKHLDREAAFEVMLLASSESQLKLGQVAALVVTETEHPAPPPLHDDLVVRTRGNGSSPGAISLDDDRVGARREAAS